VASGGAFEARGHCALANSAPCRCQLAEWRPAPPSAPRSARVRPHIRQPDRYCHRSAGGCRLGRWAEPASTLVDLESGRDVTGAGHGSRQGSRQGSSSDARAASLLWMRGAWTSRRWRPPEVVDACRAGDRGPSRRFGLRPSPPGATALLVKGSLVISMVRRRMRVASVGATAPPLGLGVEIPGDQ